MKEKLELRMYGLVNYQFTGIQQAIQFGHAVVEYGLDHFNTDLYQDWAKNNKTFIILSGGTTNDNPERPGTMQQHLEIFKEAGVNIAEFREPDMNDSLTAMCFIVDARVFDRKKYPDFEKYIETIGCQLPEYMDDDHLPNEELIKLVAENAEAGYDAWCQWIGGDTNVFLRDYLRQFKLA